MKGPTPPKQKQDWAVQANIALVRRQTNCTLTVSLKRRIVKYARFSNSQNTTRLRDWGRLTEGVVQSKIALGRRWTKCILTLHTNVINHIQYS